MKKKDVATIVSYSENILKKDSVIEKYKNCKFIAEFNNIFELLEDIGNNEEICNKKIYWST